MLVYNQKERKTHDNKKNKKRKEDKKMKIYKEVNSVYDFDFWSGAKDTVKYLLDSEVNEIISMLEMSGYDEMSETELNDFFWFETDTIAEWLG